MILQKIVICVYERGVMILQIFIFMRKGRYAFIL